MFFGKKLPEKDLIIIVINQQNCNKFSSFCCLSLKENHIHCAFMRGLSVAKIW